MNKIESVKPMKAIEGNFANRELVSSVAMCVSLGVTGDSNRPTVFINEDMSRIVIRRTYSRNGFTEKMREKIDYGIMWVLNFPYESHIDYRGDIVITRVEE